MREHGNQEDYKFGGFIPYIKIIANFLNQKWTQTHYHCLESATTAHLNHSFILVLALKTITCVMTLLVPA